MAANAGKLGSKLLPTEDAHLSGPLDLLNHEDNGNWRHGVVVYALPHMNWYRVQLSDGGGTLGCCSADSSGGQLPIGVRSKSMIAAGNNVVVWCPPSGSIGIIVGSWPRITSDAKYSLPDWVQAGGGAGFLREKAYYLPLKLFDKSSGIYNFANSRPLDQTSLDWGYVTETGIAIHMDPFMAYMRVNEMCGLFLNYWDSYLRLAGMQMDIMAPGFDMVSRDDEGEIQDYVGGIVYPWEGLGLFKNGEAVNDTFEPRDVQREKLKTRFDEKDGEEGIQSFHRYREYGGYLGQGRQRMIVVPGREEGKQRFEDDPKENPDFGVFRESIGLDGSYLLQSAKQIIIGKRVLIPVPKQVKLPEDPKGDSKEEDNYKFSGTHGGGKEHKIGSVDTSAAGDDAHLLQMAAFLDIMAYEHNWRPLHAFHYHELDYTVPEQTDAASSGPTRVMEKLNFGELSSKSHLPKPDAKQVKVDERYGEVDYFEREAGIALLPDGGIMLYDGYGSEVRLVGGNIEFTCPGDARLLPGRNLIGLGGDDIIMRAHNSLDLTAGNKDLRLKAEKNLQILGGNDGSGGVLIESKASSQSFDFDNKIGEEVGMGGVTIKSKAGFTALAGEMYLRTGRGDLGSGAIVLDSTKGSTGVELKGQQVNAFAASRVNMYIGPRDENSNVSAAHSFEANSVALNGTLGVIGRAIVADGITCGGTVLAKNAYQTVSSSEDVIPNAKSSSVQVPVNAIREAEEQLKIQGKNLHDSVFVKGLYKEKQPGNDDTIEQIAFSFRDTLSGDQYNAQTFKLAESRWQTMVRLGLGEGGDAWDEPVVTYQGNKQLPWPGKKKWEDEETILQLEELTLFDAENGVDKDRTSEEYEDPKISGSTTDTPKNAYKVIN